MWVTTDKNGSQTWFIDKPERGDGIWRGKLPIYNTECYGYFPEQTWEDDPIEIEIIEKSTLDYLKLKASQAPTVPYMGEEKF